MYEEFDREFLLGNSLEGEEWRDVENWNNFMISNMGRVYSKKRKRLDIYEHSNYRIGGMILKNTLTKSGYLVVSIFQDKRRILLKVHRMVATAFIPKVEGMDIINHKDGIKVNNKVENLEWCNQLHNNMHALKTGLRVNAMGEQSGVCNLKDKDILEAIKLHNSGISDKEIAIKYKISLSHFRNILRKKKRVYLTKDLEIKPIIIDPNKGSSKEIKFTSHKKELIIFKSIKKCSEYFKVDISTIYEWLKKSTVNNKYGDFEYHSK